MRLKVELGNIQYPIFIESGNLSELSILRPYIKGHQVLIVTNETIAPLYLDKVMQGLSAYETDNIILPDGEAYKNTESLNLIYDKLVRNHYHRDATLIALGGGVIGDLCGFAASTYQRGVNFIQIPTSLLAQVDASVGGKTAINHPVGKNMIGSFYQPQAVLIDTSTLQTLKEREYNAGMAEVIKYAFISSIEMFNYVNAFIESSSPKNRSGIEELIYRCCSIKSQFVMADEKEHGIRALLNFGHTFAHALETVTDYKRWLHGEAVAIGMCCALRLSAHLKLCDSKYLSQLQRWLHRCSLPCWIPADIDVSDLMDAMHMDKKILNNKIRLILFRKPGDCFITNDIASRDISQMLLKSIEGAEE